jgi:hypothetical protein
MESGIKLKNLSRPRIADGLLLVLLIILTALSPRFLPAGVVGNMLTIRTPDSNTEISLGIDDRRPVSGPLGTAFLVVEDGRAHLENAPCPLKICEAMGPINRSGQVIVCLPNRIVVKVSGPEEVDAISR